MAIQAEQYKKTTGSLCDRCQARCCRYYALEVDTPETLDDFEDLRWHIAHEGTVVYVEDGAWHLHVLNPCRYLDSHNRCRIYEKRPTICREHETDHCEFTQVWDSELKFTTLEELEDYIRARFGRLKYEGE